MRAPATSATCLLVTEGGPEARYPVATLARIARHWPTGRTSPAFDRWRGPEPTTGVFLFSRHHALSSPEAPVPAIISPPRQLDRPHNGIFDDSNP